MDGLRLPPSPPPFVLREYAHHHSAAQGDTRSDENSVETVFWHPVLVLPDGKAQVSFDLGDAATTYQVSGYAHSLDGRLGAITSTIEARLPLVLEPKLPLEVTASDKIDVPVSIANNTAEQQTVHMKVSPTGLAFLGKSADQEVTVPANERVRRLFRFQPSLPGREGKASVSLEGTAGAFTDKVERTLRVVPEGFPVAGSHSDLLEGAASSDVTLPETWVPGTLKVKVQVYPSTLADLQKGLEGLLREPGGCFEQTSTSNYPNLLILNYLKESDQAKPEIEKKARDMLAHGYQVLTVVRVPAHRQGPKAGLRMVRCSGSSP